MSRTPLAANGGGIAAELRDWARGCHSTEAAVELLIRARGGRFVEPGQPWLRTDDRGITWLDAQLIGQYSHAVSSGERHILALVETLAVDDDGCRRDERLHPGDPYQIGRVRVAGKCPVGLDLPGGQCGFQTYGWPSPIGSRFIGCVDPPRRKGTGSELLNGVESGNHGPRGLDLQRRRSLSEGWRRRAPTSRRCRRSR